MTSPAADPPIACTLAADAVPARVTQWRALLQRASAHTVAPDGAVQIDFGADVDLLELAGLVAAEQSCCAFFSFAITVDAKGLGLEVRAPEGAADAVTALFAPPS